MTTKSSIRNIKTKLSTSNSVNNMSTNGNDSKSSRICIKRPLSTASFIQNNSTTNGFSNHLKKRTLQLNNFINSKIKSNQSNEHPSSPPLIFHAIAPNSSNEINNLSKQESNDDSQSLASRRIANVLAHAKVQAMSTDQGSIQTESSSSEDDENQSKSHPKISSIDADADESDNGNNKHIKKTRRFQKQRQISNSSLSQKYENNNQKRHSSSNDDDDDDENKKLYSIVNGHNERRTKPISIKKSTYSTTTTTTTTDDDITKHIHRYHPLDNLESKLPQAPVLTTTNESNLSSPIPEITTKTNQPSVKKVNRFQINSIRKSQQQPILLQNDDDCSVPNNKSNLQLQPSIIERKNTLTPTTDLENGTVENGYHRVHFYVASHDRKESVVDEEKLPNQTTTTVTLPPTPAPQSSTHSAQGEDDEEGEAVAKSPDGRFIKYAKEIGRGAFKTVYRGLDTETGVPVAWCELQDFAQFDKQERTRFKEEAEMLKSLQHPNIVRFYDFWEETNPRTNKKVIILVTELMTSGSLKGYIRKFKGQKEEKRVNLMKKWCRQILKGLAYLHGRNPPVIHRDLKCDNVFITGTNGCVKIGDLGLATFKTQTFAKSMRGTMEFMAPEMFDERYDELVDIYSFGLCMLEMITGEYPYIECKGPSAVIKRVTAGLKPDCYYKVENEDVRVREIINCCIRTNKEERLPCNELLQHSFFLEDNGLRIDFVRDPSNDSQVLVTNNLINLKLKIIDKTKRKALWTEGEAILFRYNYTIETPEQIVNEFIQQKYLFDEDKKFVIQSIKDRLRAYQYEQIDRKAGVFCRDKKPTNNPTSLLGQQQVPPPQQQQQPSTIPLTAQPQVAPVPSVIPTPTVIQQPSIDVQQQQQIVKPSSEISQPKPVVQTDPVLIPQLSDLSSSVSGSAGSLEILDAQLKKTFHKTNTPQSTSTITSINNGNSEIPTSLVNQDESSISKLGNDTAVIDQQQKEESGGTVTDELTTNISQSSTSQTQSQPTTMSTNHQSQVLQNPPLLCLTSQGFPHSINLINTTLSNDSTKPISSSIITETIENNHVPISPSHTNETNPLSISSDTTTQPPIMGSLKRLDALLKNTFKNPSKTTGTAHNSDTETTNPNISLIINDENPTKLSEIESDETKRKLLDLFNTSNPTVSSIVQSQPNTSSIVLSKSIQQVKSQPTVQIPINFDPFISSETDFQGLDVLIKTSDDKSLTNDDTITGSSSNDFSEIKLMIMDLNKMLLNRINIIENKIDEHRNQTIQINNLLTNTVLPSLFDLADIIHQTPNIDSRIRTKLENIQTNIRSSQEQTVMKDLMEI